jgi:hypothetical protein
LMIWFVVPDDYGNFAVRGKIVFLSAQAHRYIPPTEAARPVPPTASWQTTVRAIAATPLWILCRGGHQPEQADTPCIEHLHMAYLTLHRFRWLTGPCHRCCIFASASSVRDDSTACMRRQSTAQLQSSDRVLMRLGLES